MSLLSLQKQAISQASARERGGRDGETEGDSEVALAFKPS